MESVANFTYRRHHHHHHQLPLTLHHHRRRSISKPISSLPFTTQFPSLKISSCSSPIKASLSNSPSPIPNPQQKPSISPLKTTLITAVTAAAVFLSQLNLKPVLATTAVSAPPPPATVESESVENPEIESVNVADPEEEDNEGSVRKESESDAAETEIGSDSDSVADPAEKNLKQRIASNPKDVESLQKLMEIKLKGKKLAEALVLLAELQNLEPDNEDWPILKAYIHTQTGNHKASKKTFQGIISKDPFRIEAYHGLIMIASQMESGKELIEAEKKIKEGLEKAKKSKNKSEREFKVLLAQVLVIKGDYDNALRIYKDLIEEEPKDFRPYLCQGIIYTLLKKDVDAEASFEKYRKLVPKGHPYGEYFEDNMRAAKLFVQKAENEKSYSKN